MKKYAPFRFKEFSVHHENSAMKVGTDGVLLGSWIQANNPMNILDIGTGTGLISLMMAQRFNQAIVVGVEPNDNAIVDAFKNVNDSAFKDRIDIVHGKIQNYTTEKRFDLILSNPPFFQNALNAEDSDRNQARQGVDLTPNELLEISNELLIDNGFLSVIIPFDHCRNYRSIAKKVGLSLSKMTSVRGTPSKPFKRALLTFSKKELPLEEDVLTIERSRHVYTDEYIALTKPFYLAM